MLITNITNALRRARYEVVDDMYCATVPGLRGVVATGPTVEVCRTQLAEVIEGWVYVRVAQGLRVPTIGGARTASFGLARRKPVINPSNPSVRGQASNPSPTRQTRQRTKGLAKGSKGSSRD